VSLAVIYSYKGFLKPSWLLCSRLAPDNQIVVFGGNCTVVLLAEVACGFRVQTTCHPKLPFSPGRR